MGCARVLAAEVHILQLYKDYYPVLGGIENHVRDLSEGLVARGHRVTVLVTNLANRTMVEQPHPGLTIIKAARTLHLASTPLSLAMARLARQIHPDLVHLHFPYPPGDLIYQAMPAGPPLIVTYHSDIVRQQMLLRVYRPLMELTLRRAAAIRARYDAPLLLFVGRLRYYKGLHILLDALPRVRAELLIGGSGPERARLAAQASQLGIARRVHFLGDIPDGDLPALFRAADIFVLPAHLRAEALGLAQIEALASGLPCVSTELGTGTSYANLHGTTGLVVPPGDPAALAQAINALLADPAMCQRFGAAGQRRVAELFSQAHMLDAVESVYREVLT